MKLYYHPISGYAQKVLVAFYEKNVPFTGEIVNLFDQEETAKYRDLYPIGKIPLLIDDNDYKVPESSIIIEFLDSRFPQPLMIPADLELSRRTRFMDRMLDLYLSNQVSSLLFASTRPPEQRNEKELKQARYYVDCSYQYMNHALENNSYLMGESLTLADTAAVPALFYAQRVCPFDDHVNIQQYFERLKQRPSISRVYTEATAALEQANLF